MPSRTPSKASSLLRLSRLRLPWDLSLLARSFLLLVGFWLLVLGVHNARHRSDWAVGDWLINYAGGFVRRGLLGEGALLLRGVHLSPVWTVLGLQWALYTIILYTIYKLMPQGRWQLWFAAFFFSPATLAFPLLSPSFGFRKEILLFALLGLTLLRFRGPNAEESPNRGADLQLSLFVTLGCAVCILSHEALFVFFPYLFAALLLGMRQIRRAVVCFAPSFLVSVALFVLVSHFPGSSRTSEVVCRSMGGVLTEPPTGICGGAIAYLGRTSAYAHSEVLRVAHLDHYARRIPLVAALALLPPALGLLSMRRERPFAFKTLVLTAAVAWAISSSVFYYGTDWTRWIYIHVFCLFLLTLFEQYQGNRFQTGSDAVLGTSRTTQRIAAILLVCYCFGWELTEYGQPLPLGGFLHFVRHDLLR